MGKITLKEFLEQNDIINKAALSKKMYPQSPASAKTRLHNKLVNTKTIKSSTQRVTENDLAKAKSVLNELAKQILDFNSNSTL